MRVHSLIAHQGAKWLHVNPTQLPAASTARVTVPSNVTWIHPLLTMPGNSTAGFMAHENYRGSLVPMTWFQSNCIDLFVSKRKFRWSIQRKSPLQTGALIESVFATNLRLQICLPGEQSCVKFSCRRTWKLNARSLYMAPDQISRGFSHQKRLHDPDSGKALN